MRTFLKKIRDYYFNFRPLPSYYGTEFKEIFDFINKSCRWPREKLEQFKLDRLRALVAHAVEHVAYYRDLFKKHDINPADIKTFEDYARIPVLTKKMLHDNLELLKADNIKSFKPISTETSGTTGLVTKLYRSEYQEAFRKAIVWRFYRQNGHDFRHPWASLTSNWGDPQKSTIYEHDRIENCLVINNMHVIHGNHRPVLEALRAFEPEMILAHPGVLCSLADYIVRHKLQPIEVSLIITYGEKIFDHVRRLLKQAFHGCYVEYYGNRENSIGAWGHSDSRFYEMSEYCHLEMAESNCFCGRDCCGDLISTSLHNYCVPLIRYNSEDMVSWEGYLAGNNYPQFELLGGRGKDLLLSREGLVVPYTPVYFDRQANSYMKKYQLVQTEIDQVTLKIVPKDGFKIERDEPRLIDQFSRMLSGRFNITVKYVEDIPYTRNGKYRVSVSPLTLEYLNADVSFEANS